jgi:ribosomal protein L44E
MKISELLGTYCPCCNGYNSGKTQNISKYSAPCVYSFSSENRNYFKNYLHHGVLHITHPYLKLVNKKEIWMSLYAHLDSRANI